MTTASSGSQGKELHHSIRHEPVEECMSLCPKPECKAVMRLDPARAFDPEIGLEYLRCSRCGHRGMRARDGLRLLFSANHEYLLSYGPSPSFLRVELSANALSLFQAHGMTPARLATYAAEWALMMGQASGTVNVGGDNLLLSGCYDYYRRQALNDLRHT